MPKSILSRIITANLFALVLLLGWQDYTHAAGNTSSAPADVKAAVKTKILIVTNRHADFGQTFTGDAADTIATSETVRTAEFKVTGAASAAFVITGLTGLTLNIITGAGDTADRRIAVDNFAHNAGDSPALSTAGENIFRVGMRRAAIRETQVPANDYKGTFTVTAAYP